MTGRERTRLRKSLLAWYEANKRELPWRDISDPYAILVSEFMLQQTQVATVLPYYERFLKRFPTLDALAEASETSVRAAWSGLGYYRRARNLQATARSVVRDHQGVVPNRIEGLRELPGVGDYTAAALGSLIHDIPTGVVDGNVIRVLTRLTGHRELFSTAASKRKLQDLADDLVDPGRPGDWNQAMMELGAVICSPRKPSCPQCPWKRPCIAHKDGDPETYPRKPPPSVQVSEERAAGILSRKTNVLLTHRSDPRLLDATWELPWIEITSGDDPRARLAEHLAELLVCEVSVGEELARIRHSITNRRLKIRGYKVEVQPSPRAKKDSRLWASPVALDEIPVSSMTTKMLRAIRNR